AQIFKISRLEASNAQKVITCKLKLFNVIVYPFIDIGSTHSFITSRMTHSLLVKPKPLTKSLGVRTPLGLVIMVNTIYQNYFVNIKEVTLLT
ncbi:hypothetical protein J0J30_23455, partial [Vibrio vulnificus]|nr:hypothetical protein [Vibrio vulnificus]